LLILGIDTSGPTASTALYNGSSIAAQYSFSTARTHSQVILPLCKQMLADSGKTLDEIDSFAVSSGPGSYTGLRIGISAVKAMAFALNKKCFGISTLESLAFNTLGFNTFVCSIMKARTNLFYTAVFRSSHSSVTRISKDSILSDDDILALMSEFDNDIIFTGDGAEEFRSLHPMPNFFIAPPHLNHQLASGLCLACINHAPIAPDELQACYLQPTKAEKELDYNQS